MGGLPNAVKLVIQNTSHVWGGNEKWLATVATGAAERGHEVVVSCSAGPVREELESRGIRTSGYRPRGVLDVVSGLTFGAWLARERPDVLLATSWQPVTWTTLAAAMARVPRMVLRQGIVREFPRMSPRAVALRRMDALIVNSTEIRDVWLRSAPWFPPEKMKVVLNGVVSRIGRREERRRRIREELDADPETLLIGGAGHLAPRKGFDLLLGAFAAAGVKDCRLVIIGEGDYRRELESIASALNIRDRVRWLGHRSDGPDLIAGLDLFVLTSRNEGMANVMLEAMAGGTPVIASDISGVRKAIGESDGRGAAGWIVPAGDVKAIAAAVREVEGQIRSGTPDVLQRVHEAHWRTVNWFGTDRMVQECLAILFDTP